jgi:hypothetical protein
VRSLIAAGTAPFARYVVRGWAFGIFADTLKFLATSNKIKRDSAKAKDSPRHLREPAKNGK